MSIKKIITAFALLITTALPLQSFAAEATSSTVQKNPWTDCGIGAMIFDNTKWAAAISNVIWDLGTTAVTSAYASNHTCSGKSVVAALFINQTYANLEEETANGSGSHVSAMLNILGCDSAAHEGITASLRNDLNGNLQNVTYVTKSTSEKAQDYYRALDVAVSTKYAQQCHAI